MDDEEKPTPEYLGPEEYGPPAPPELLIQALVNQYTERPDLFLAEMEKHDPGFVKRMNADIEGFAKQTRTSKFNFGRFQAYTALIVSAISALTILGGVLFLIYSGNASFWTIIALAFFLRHFPVWSIRIYGYNRIFTLTSVRQ